VIDFVREMSDKTDISTSHIVSWLKFSRSKYYDWQKRYGKANEHNGFIPRDFWLENWEKEAIVDYFIQHPFEGYRRLTYIRLQATAGGSPALAHGRYLSQPGRHLLLHVQCAGWF
jgi:hypothetical protein